MPVSGGPFACWFILHAKNTLKPLKYSDAKILLSLPVEIRTPKAVGERNAKANYAVFPRAQEIVDSNGKWIIWRKG
jgi:hypothetical protein